MHTFGEFEFHHVGQGLFYSGRLDLEGERKNIVYDCGTFFEKELLEYEIDGAFSNNDTIDLLMISHFDADHINGLQYLLNRVKKVESLFMPFIEPEELLFLATKYQSPKSRRKNEEYVNMISDIRTLWGNEKIKNIILLSESSGKDFPDDTERFPLEWNGDSEGIVFKFYRDKERQTIFDERYFHENNSLGRKVKIAQYDGKLSFSQGWDFQFYINNEGKEERKNFHAALVKRGIGITSFSDIQRTVRDKVLLDNLKDAYREINRNLNLRSMIVLHKPIESEGLCTEIAQVIPVRCISNLNFSCYPHCIECFGSTYEFKELSTILFGDGKISTHKELNRMGKHFEDALDCCMVALLPHHGSRHNWKKDVLSCVKSRFWIVSFGIHGKFGHPNTKVLEDFHSSWKFVHGYDDDDDGRTPDEIPYLLFCNEYQSVVYRIKVSDSM